MTPTPSPTDSAPAPPASARPVTLLAAAALVAGNMIGVGVFTSLGFQVLSIQSGFVIALLWALGGVIALCGALSYAELGAALPRSGGEYHLVGRVWHPVAGFLSGWVSVTVGFAAPVAMAAMAFGTYLTASVGNGAPDFAVKLWATGLIVLTTAVHLGSIAFSARFQSWATALKAALILVLIVAGWFFAPGQPVTFAPAAGDAAALTSAAFAVSLFWVGYSYSGWNAAVYIAGEMKNPGRDLPRALLLGTGVVTVLYVLVNAAFLRAAPVAELAGKPEVALVAARHAFGETGGRTMGLLIALGLVSLSSAMMWAGPRVTQAMGQDFRALRGFAAVTGRGIPWLAVLTQAALALVLLWAGTFEQVRDYLQFTLELSTFVAVAGVFWLRWREPGLPRPFRAWGYPFTPAVFLFFTGYVLVRVAQSKPLESSLGAATVALGGIVFAVSHRSAAGKSVAP